MTVPLKSKEKSPFWISFYSLIKYFLSFIIRTEHCNESDVCLAINIHDYHSGKTYDQVFITDNEEIHQWASKDRYRLRLFKFLQKYRYICCFFNLSHIVNPVWESVLRVDAVINENEPIFVTDTLILQCRSIESYRMMIPLIRGSYNKLVLQGHMSWYQIKQLIHPGVKQVRVNATFEMLPVEIEHENFVNYIMKHCRGPEYKFVIAYEAKCPKELLKKLHIALRSHESHGTTNCDRSYPVIHSVRNIIYFFGVLLIFLIPLAFLCYYVKDENLRVLGIFLLSFLHFPFLFIVAYPVPVDIKNDVVNLDFPKFYRYLNDE